MLILCFTYQHHDVHKGNSGNTGSYLVQPTHFKNRYLLQKGKKFLCGPSTIKNTEEIHNEFWGGRQSLIRRLVLHYGPTK